MPALLQTSSIFRSLSSLAMILLIVVGVSSCGLMARKIEVREIPYLPPIVLPPEPRQTDFADRLPQPLVLSSAEAAYYAEACEAFQSGEYTTLELSSSYPGLTPDAACNWSLACYTVAGTGQFDEILNDVALEFERNRDIDAALRRIIQSIETVVRKRNEDGN